jgi:hypothetical protein
MAKKPTPPRLPVETFYVPVTLGARVAVKATCQEAAVAKLQSILGTGYRYRRALLISLTEHMVLDMTRPVLQSADFHNIDKEIG